MPPGNHATAHTQPGWDSTCRQAPSSPRHSRTLLSSLPDAMTNPAAASHRRAAPLQPWPPTPVGPWLPLSLPPSPPPPAPHLRAPALTLPWHAATLKTMEVWPKSVDLTRPCASHTFTLRSCEPVTKPPSAPGSTAIERTVSVWPVWTATHSVPRHTLTVASAEPDRRYPEDVAARQSTELVWPSITASQTPSVSRHTRMVRSTEPEATRPPGSAASAATWSVWPTQMWTQKLPLHTRTVASIEPETMAPWGSCSTAPGGMCSSGPTYEVWPVSVRVCA
mmetsp:Transcript_25548/g.75524  ORF Transcript_25548/g.75524 Transcript_25548/m.75524 type:complete len:279 (+) Transcript_25548:1392-2228(+)